MIEQRIDFDGDWPLWQHLCHEFWAENGYWVFEEMPDWIRATQTVVHDIRLFQDNHKTWAVFYFLRAEDLTAFLLRWK